MKRDRKAEALRWLRQAEEELMDAAFLKEYYDEVKKALELSRKVVELTRRKIGEIQL
jgi:hypothetical protein